MDRVQAADGPCHRTTMVVGTITNAPLPGCIFGAPDYMQARTARAAALQRERVLKPEGRRVGILSDHE